MPIAVSDDDIITLKAQDNLLLQTDSARLAKRYKPFAKPKQKPKPKKSQGTPKQKNVFRNPKAGDKFPFSYLVGTKLVPFEGILVEETADEEGARGFLVQFSDVPEPVFVDFPSILEVANE